ncbi:hypothetical protein [Pseudomonas sp. KCJK9111]|uniref:hypothetical protein n=1 Tax=Pseudomonas sp. KCJK9111 TaxID=3344555 RepID=UPI00390667CD
MSRFLDARVNGYNKSVIDNAGLKRGQRIHVNGDGCWFLQAESTQLHVLYVDKNGKFTEDYARRYPVTVPYTSIETISEVPCAEISLESQDPENYRLLEQAYQEGFGDLTRAGAKLVTLDDIKEQSTRSVPVLIEIKPDVVDTPDAIYGYGVALADTYGILCYLDAPPSMTGTHVSVSRDSALEQRAASLGRAYGIVYHFRLAFIDSIKKSNIHAIYALTDLPELTDLKTLLVRRAQTQNALIAAGAISVERAQWAKLSDRPGPFLVELHSPEQFVKVDSDEEEEVSAERASSAYDGIFGMISNVQKWSASAGSLQVTCDESTKQIYEALITQVDAASRYATVETITLPWGSIKTIYSMADVKLEQDTPAPAHDTPERVPAWWGESETPADNDTLPNMTGFEPAQLGAGQEVWRSLNYLLADRDLQVDEYLHAWVINETDGSIVKHVAWKAAEATLALAKWPEEFLKAVNAAPVDPQGYKWLCAGHLTVAGELSVSESGSPTTAAFTALTSTGKDNLNRLWVYGSGLRLFTNAPFVANQAIVSRLSDSPPPPGESISVQVRDRTSLRLYETYLFEPTIDPERSDDPSITAALWSKALCSHINAKCQDRRYGLLRAGVLGSDGVTIEPADKGNALWVAQHADLSVELDSMVWQKYRTATTFTPQPGSVIQIWLYDRYSAEQLPGSPLRYTVKSTDATAAKCLESLAQALHASDLGEYLRLGTRDSAQGKPTGTEDWMLWHMPLPVRIVVTGVPGLTSGYEPALETPEGQPLTLGELYKNFKDGLTLALSDRWTGQVVDSWDFTQAEDELDTGTDAARFAKWVKGLGELVASSFARWGTRQAILTQPDVEANDLADRTLWLPKDAEVVLVAHRLITASLYKSRKPPKLEQRIIYKRNQLIWEEAQYYSYYTEWTSQTDYSTQFSKILSWGDDVLTARDVGEIRSRYFSYNPTSVKTITYADFQFKGPSANTPVLVASRLARDDLLYARNDVWQLQYPSNHITQRRAGSEGHVVVQFTKPDHDYLYLLGILRVIQATRDNESLNEKKMSDSVRNAMRSGWFDAAAKKLTSIDALRPQDTACFKQADELVSALANTELLAVIEHYKIAFLEVTIKCEYNWFLRAYSLNSVQVQNMFYDLPLVREICRPEDEIQEIFNKLCTLPATSPEISSIKSELLESARRVVLGEEKTYSEATWTTLQALGKLDIAHEPLLVQLLCGEQNPDQHHLHLQLTPAARAKGFRIIDYSADLSPDIRRIYELSPDLRSWNGGIHLHIPEGATLDRADGLCSASYVNRSGITPAFFNTAYSNGALGPMPLTIEMPFKGRTFIPKDSLCADYAGTLGSELYDVSGASENGVDSKTGLFHAHYPVGVIRGLAGKGPELDLTLHYAATRANESALGDGWAFRFSVYDNRLHRLTLHSGQTITLTAEHVGQANGKKRLTINGVTLTGAKGNHGALTGLTVVFPSGRSEVLAKPDPHDGKEASENYKEAFVSKVKKLKENLEQWLKESGVSKEQKETLQAKIQELSKLESDIKRKAYLLVPRSITASQGGVLTLSWEGKEGHVHLQHIADGDTTLMIASHETPVAEGEYSSTFTVWPDTEETYTVKLCIKDCLLTQLTRQGKNDAKPVQTVVFGYEGEPVLDRVLCSIAEEDGSLEAVSYGPTWKDWDNSSDSLIPLSRVLRHTLVPGAGQLPITHIWEWHGSSSLMKEGATFSSTCSLDSGSHREGPSTSRTWTLKNGFIVETQVVEKLSHLVRQTTSMIYPDTVASSDPAVRFRLATQPISTTVTTEDLRAHSQPTAPVDTVVDKSAEERHP